MGIRFFTAILLLAAIESYAFAQVDPPATMTPEELTASVLSLQDQLKQLSDAVTGNSSNLATVIDQQKMMADKLQEVSDQLGQSSKDRLELVRQVKEVTVQLGQVRTSQDEFQSEISDQIWEINTQLGQISRSVGGSRTLRFDNIQDEPTRTEFQNLVKETTPRTGKLTVKNKMPIGQYIFINRAEHYISSGQQQEFDVPTGSVSTRLPGQKVVAWSISAPDYEHTIQIVPDVEPVRTLKVSPSPPVIYQALPYYVEPVSYISIR